MDVVPVTRLSVELNPARVNRITNIGNFNKYVELYFLSFSDYCEKK